jgi:hypothetical protein
MKTLPNMSEQIEKALKSVVAESSQLSPLSVETRHSEPAVEYEQSAKSMSSPPEGTAQTPMVKVPPGPHISQEPLFASSNEKRIAAPDNPL